MLTLVPELRAHSEMLALSSSSVAKTALPSFFEFDFGFEDFHLTVFFLELLIVEHLLCKC